MRRIASEEMSGLIASHSPSRVIDADAQAQVEDARLQALHELDLLDTAAEERFDRLTALAATAFRAPMVMVSLVDRERVWFKSKVGVQAAEVPRAGSFCGHAIRGRDVLVVPDARVDPRFSTSPLVLDAPRIRFYAGAPLRTKTGECIGTLCLVDDQPREFGADDQAHGRLIVAGGGTAAAAGQLEVFGTNGIERVEVLGGNAHFDGSFNRGGDVVSLPFAAEAFTAVRQGSSVRLQSETLELLLPVGTAGLALEFVGGDERDLLFSSAAGGVLIGDQLITAAVAALTAFA